MKLLSLLLISIFLLLACKEAKPHLEEIRERGELRVLTRYGPTSYYIKGDQLAGFEYELAERFAKHLNVKLKIIIPENLTNILNLIEQGKGDIAAAGLTVTPAREELIRFGPVYQEVTQQLVYRQGTKRPKNLANLADGQLEVIANSSHVEQLKSHKEEIPDLEWTENRELESSGLLELVQLEMVDYTIADSNEIAANRQLFPELRVAFNVSDPQPLAWALPLSEDSSLYDEVQIFFEKMEESGDLDRLIEKYYGHIHRFDYLDTRTIHRRIQTRLPKYQALFEQAAEQYGYDWRLLAAISYQESHWDNKAVSSTGVKGLMMLTLSTAKQVGITDRQDPKQSIPGGAKYLSSVQSRLPDQIESKQDRLWLALASYNVGLGHVEDARIITQSNGGNPNLWSDVRQNLPLLAKKKWYKHTRYGYARGGEPVRYVENIRRYYDILLQTTVSGEKQETSPEPEKNAQETPAAL